MPHSGHSPTPPGTAQEGGKLPFVSPRLVGRAVPPPESRRRHHQHQRGMTFSHSFDDLVGKVEDRGRDREPERVGSVEVHDELELYWLLHRQFGGIVSL